ncbi:MAG TPA: hypothetical protein VFT27_11515 [Actinomycetota bacterium]|nr:hypothetical protein [Actinomycetota bacterium]
MSLISVGLAVIVLAVLLFGLTTESGEVDWVSVITAVAGVVMVAVGAFIAFRGRGTSTGSNPNTAA